MNTKLNKRKTKRQFCYVPVEAKKGTPFDKICTVDISRDGIGFISQKRVKVDEKVAIAVELTSEGKTALVLGQVKWIREMPQSAEYRLGIKFTNILVQGSKAILKSYFGKKANKIII